MRLPIFQSKDTALMLMQTKWSGQLSPLIANPITQGIILSQVHLINGDLVINHSLGRKLVGWIIIGIGAAATIYDKQATNQTPDLTLVLNSSAATTVNLYVF